MDARTLRGNAGAWCEQQAGQLGDLFPTHGLGRAWKRPRADPAGHRTTSLWPLARMPMRDGMSGQMDDASATYTCSAASVGGCLSTPSRDRPSRPAGCELHLRVCPQTCRARQPAPECARARWSQSDGLKSGRFGECSGKVRRARNARKAAPLGGGFFCACTLWRPRRRFGPPASCTRRPARTARYRIHCSKITSRHCPPTKPTSRCTPTRS